MYWFLTPRWVVGAALAAFLVGAVGLWSGEMRWSPLALLVGELLAIYAAILWTTPTIPPFSTRPVDTAESEQPADNTPTTQADGADAAAESSASAATEER